jgi:hypothetical protein
MLVRFRALSGHRSTLTSSVVASFDTGPLSGYGYSPTLTSSVVALGLARLRDNDDAGAVGVVQSFSRSIMENQTVADCHIQLGYGTMMIPVRCASFKVFSRSIAVYNMPGTGELWHHLLVFPRSCLCLLRYHVARQRGTIDETSREKVSSNITALLVNVGCWSGSVRCLAIAPR